LSHIILQILLAEHQQLQGHLGQLLKRCHVSQTPHEKALQEHLDSVEGCVDPEEKARRNLLPAFRKSGWRTILEIEVVNGDVCSANEFKQMSRVGVPRSYHDP
jgi:hypothetical protein